MGRGAPSTSCGNGSYYLPQNDTSLMLGPDSEKSIELKAGTGVGVAEREAVKNQLSSRAATLRRFPCFRFHQLCLCEHACNHRRPPVLRAWSKTSPTAYSPLSHHLVHTPAWQNPTSDKFNFVYSTPPAVRLNKTKA